MALLLKTKYLFGAKTKELIFRLTLRPYSLEKGKFYFLASFECFWIPTKKTDLFLTSGSRNNDLTSSNLSLEKDSWQFSSRYNKRHWKAISSHQDHDTQPVKSWTLLSLSQQNFCGHAVLTADDGAAGQIRDDVGGGTANLEHLDYSLLTWSLHQHCPFS